jgi:hypothetical protein
VRGARRAGQDGTAPMSADSRALHYQRHVYLISGAMSFTTDAAFQHGSL